MHVQTGHYCHCCLESFWALGPVLGPQSLGPLFRPSHFKCNTLHKSPLVAEINFYSKSLSEGRATAGKAVQHGVGHTT